MRRIHCGAAVVVGKGHAAGEVRGCRRVGRYEFDGRCDFHIGQALGQFEFADEDSERFHHSDSDTDDRYNSGSHSNESAGSDDTDGSDGVTDSDGSAGSDIREGQSVPSPPTSNPSTDDDDYDDRDVENTDDSGDANSDADADADAAPVDTYASMSESHLRELHVSHPPILSLSPTVMSGGAFVFFVNNYDL